MQGSTVKSNREWLWSVQIRSTICKYIVHKPYSLYIFSLPCRDFQYNIISNVIFDFILTWRKLSFSCDFFFFNDVVLSKGSINLCYSVGSPFRHSLLVIIFLSIYIFATLLLIRTNMTSTKCILIFWQIPYNLDVEVTFLNTFHDLAHHLEENIRILDEN